MARHLPGSPPGAGCKKQSGAREGAALGVLACYFSLMSGPACVMLPFTNSVSIFSF